MKHKLYEINQLVQRICHFCFPFFEVEKNDRKIIKNDEKMIKQKKIIKKDNKESKDYHSVQFFF